MPRYEVVLQYTGAVWLTIYADTEAEARTDAVAKASTSDLQCGEFVVVESGVEE